MPMHFAVGTILAFLCLCTPQVKTMNQPKQLPFTGPNLLRVLELERKAMRRLERLARKITREVQRLRSDQIDDQQPKPK